MLSPNQIGRWLVLLALVGMLPGCRTALEPQREPTASPATRATRAAAEVAAIPEVTKPVSFAILEDYGKGEDLRVIAMDFKRMRELGMTELRCSVGWDDYEPERGQYDFIWLKRFCAVARDHGINVRPYIGYTPRWAGIAGRDDQDWNNPPADMETWRQFVFRLVTALRDQTNVLSYEIYNKENAPFWWDGTIQQYMQTLKVGSEAVRAANPKANVLLGGLAFPDAGWLSTIAGAGLGPYYDVVPFHAYAETSSEPGETVENYLAGGYRTGFVQHAVGKPIWINEMGFAISPGKTEEQQAQWFARAVSTFLADPDVQQIGVYELKDSRPESPVSGERENYYLGLIDVDGRKRVAFDTVRLLVSLLNTGTITTADADATVQVTTGTAGELYHHLFRRPDGKQVLFVYDKQASPAVDIRLKVPGRNAVVYDLKGEATPWQGFDGPVLSGVQLEAGKVRIFLIDP